MKTLHKKFLGQLLVESFMITQVQLEKALNAQREQGGRLAALLMQFGYLKPSKFCEFMAKQPGVASISIGAYPVDHALVELIPREFAESREVFPLDRLGSLLTVAMVCPLDVATVQELEEITGLRVKPLLCEPGDLYTAIQRYYPEQQDMLEVELAFEVKYMAHDRVLAQSAHHHPTHAHEASATQRHESEKSGRLSCNACDSAHAVFDFLPARVQEVRPAEPASSTNIVPFRGALARRTRQNAESIIQVLHCSPCPSCGQETPDRASGYQYCGHCGSELAASGRISITSKDFQSSIFCWPAATA